MRPSVAVILTAARMHVKQKVLQRIVYATDRATLSSAIATMVSTDMNMRASASNDHHVQLIVAHNSDVYDDQLPLRLRRWVEGDGLSSRGPL